MGRATNHWQAYHEAPDYLEAEVDRLCLGGEQNRKLVEAILYELRKRNPCEIKVAAELRLRAAIAWNEVKKSAVATSPSDPGVGSRP